MVIRIGVALPGGGMRCAAQAGVLIKLFEMGIRPAYYAGCGAGALVAALAATDALSDKQVETFSKAARYNARCRALTLERLLRKTFGAVPLREANGLAMPTIDLETGAVQVLASALPVIPDPRPWSRQAMIANAVRASMGTPGVLAPVNWRGRKLSGGGSLRGTLPTILRAMGAERIIVIQTMDVGCAQIETHPAALALCAHAMVAAPPPACDMLISVSGIMPGCGVLDTKTARPMLEAGKLAGIKALPGLEMLMGPQLGKIVPFPLRGYKGDTSPV